MNRGLSERMIFHRNSIKPPVSFLNKNIENFYSKIREPELDSAVFSIAYKGYDIFRKQNRVLNDSILTIIDYSKPSVEKRLFVIHLKDFRVLYKTYVSHGKNSGEQYATEFSNKMQSHKSSLGFFITGETYSGKHGYSLTLNGMEEKFNSLARKRGVVVHGAKYVSQSYIDKYGRLGRSFGCPALPIENTREIIDLIKDGSCFFCYYPDQEYFKKSDIIIKINQAE